MYGAFTKAITLVALAILVVVYSINPLSTPIKTGLDFPGVMTSLGGMFVIVVLVERVTEIAVTIWRQSSSNSIKAEIDHLKNDSAKANELLEKEKSLASYQSETKSIALLTGFTISIVVCCAGVGLLSTIVDTTASTGNVHFLRGVDIFLTSGLIAGGSDSFHQFVSTLEAFFNESKIRMGNRA